jgi:bla regulator protein BlaR1
MTGLLNHLWQSSLFAIMAGLLTLFLRRNPARARYWLWFAASVKFLIPFSLLVDAGSRVEWRTASAIAQPAVSVSMEQVFTAPAIILGAPEAAPRHANYWPTGLGVVWFCGSATVLFAWWRQWRRIRSALRTARPAAIPLPMEARFSPALLEPGVFGVFRPVLLLPEGIAERLMPQQLDAIVAHELCHVRSYDNLAAAVHMLVEAIFWFHPLVWWIGKRLVDERERACDEEVLRSGSEPEVYAESILKVCEFYLESPLDCVSGITGSDLRKRIRNIMTEHASIRLNAGRKLLLAVAGVAAVVTPIVVGVLNAPGMHAQSQPSEALAFEVASVKPNKSGSPREPSMILPGGRFTATNNTVRALILNAYGIFSSPYLLSGGPSWIDSERYDVEARAEAGAILANAPNTVLLEKTRLMLRTLLADRFHLSVRRETKEMPVYELVVSKNGPKLNKSAQEQDCDALTACHGFSGNPMRLTGTGVDMADLVLQLSYRLGRPVLDKTVIQGLFDIKLQWNPFVGRSRPAGDTQRSPEAEARDGPRPDPDTLPAVFEALEQQIGLKLVAAKGPVDVFIVEHVERPSGNDQAFFRKAMWTPPQAFEVASIKPAPSSATERGITRKPGGRLSTSNATVKQLVYLAYQVMPPQVSGGPDWVGSAGFDIEAKPADAKIDMAQFRQMIKTLLAERFQLKFHMETKQLPVYELLVGKRGVKLTEDKSESLEVGMRNLRGELQGDKATMPMLAGSLTRVLQRQVVDKTGLNGAYTFRLQFLPDQKLPGPDEGVAIPTNDGASIFTALQEQLGLNLRATKGPVEMLVIDQAERPSVDGGK